MNRSKNIFRDLENLRYKVSTKIPLLTAPTTTNHLTTQILALSMIRYNIRSEIKWQ